MKTSHIILIMNNFTPINEKLRKARILLEQKRFKEVISLATEMVQHDPELDFPYHFLALGFLGLNKYDKAIEHANIALEKDAQNPSNHYTKATILMDMNNFKDAHTSIDNAIVLSAISDADFFALKAIILWNLGKFSETEKIVDKGLKIDPDNINLKNIRVTNLVNKGLMNDGEDLLSQNLTNDPNDNFNLALKGTFLLGKEKYTQAEELFISALQKNPFNVMAKDGLLQIAKSKSSLYTFYLQNGFKRFIFKISWRTFLNLIRVTPFMLLLGIPLLLMSCFFNIAYETYLRFSSKTRHLLRPDLIIRSNIFIILFLLSIILFCLALRTGEDNLWKLFGIVFWSFYPMGLFFELKNHPYHKRKWMILSIILGIATMVIYSHIPFYFLLYLYFSVGIYSLPFIIQFRK